MQYGAIEAGGTKFVCAVADENVEITEKVSFPTTTPEETFEKIFSFFDQYELDSMGIGSFGPIGINQAKENYGHILATPKKGWTNFDFLGTLQKKYAIPFVWTTDVNAAAYGEMEKGAAKGKDSCIYLTIGTGIGAGIIIDRQIFQGTSNPEMGHIFVKRHPEDDYEGNCPYHKDCLEGLAAGPSLEARAGVKGQDLPADHAVWDILAFYIAQALMTYTLTLSPEIIVLGGGVMNQDHLLPKIQQEFVQQMGGYMEIPNVEQYIVRWGLPNESGIQGSLLLAETATRNEQN